MYSSNTQVERTASGHLSLAFGTQSERNEFLPILAEALGIQGDHSLQPHVMGTMLKAQSWMKDFAAVPGLHMEAIPFKNNRQKRTDYSLIMKYNWSTHNLSEYNREHADVQYILTERTATPDEIQQQYAMLGDSYVYDPRDVGVWGGLLDTRMDPEFIKAMSQAGINFVTWHFGCYRHKVALGNFVKEENLPVTDTKERVALRRAHKKAINHQIPPYPIVNAFHREDMFNYAYKSLMGNHQESKRNDPRERAPVIESVGTSEDEDGMLWAVAPSVAQNQSPLPPEPEVRTETVAIEATRAVQDAPEAQQSNDVDFYGDDAPKDSSGRSELAQAGIESWIEFLRMEDNKQPTREQATPGHYKKLLWEMRQWLPKSGAQPPAILAHILDRPISEDDTPAKSVVTKILRLIQKETNYRLPSGGWSTDYIDNPNHDPIVIEWVQTLNRDLAA